VARRGRHVMIRITLQQSTFRRFAAKYYHLFLLKMVSVIFPVLEVSF